MSHPADPQNIETESIDPARFAGRAPKRIGRYHIKRVIASGGMGTVFEATQENPRRVVAVKVMKQGIASRSALRRFEYEGQILGRLRHPGIAQIFEAGMHEDQEGVFGPAGAITPYFAMEYIPNARPITIFAAEKKLSTRHRLELFAKVCDAVHHGHQKGIIHRDLKPSNILVDSSGQVKIIDFGVARTTDSDMAITTLQTDVGQLIGTLQYMSPEQCEADPHDIDIRSDVYALGVVFYELLCGKLPYDVTRVAMHEATRVIREQHPAKLSTLNKTLRGDAETIALKALEKERERRYQSATEFAQDIQRHLSGEAILARRASIVYQLRLFARRNKAVFFSLAAVFVILVTGIIASTSMYLRAESARLEQARERERAEQARELADEQRQRAQEAEASAAAEADRAEKEAQTALQVTDFLVGLFEVSDPSQALGNTITAREILDRGVKKIGDELKDQPVVRATLQDTMGRVYTSLGLYDPAEGLLREALAKRRQLLGDEHPDVATSLTNLGILPGVGEEAESLLREALAIRRRVYGDEHKDVAKSLYWLAATLSGRTDYAEAEQLFREALTIQRKLLGEEHYDTIETLHDIAHMSLWHKEYDEAERQFRELLPLTRKALGEEHRITTAALHNLAFAVAGRGQYDEAERVMLESFAMSVKLLGPDHPELVASLIFLVELTERRGDFEEAERLARQSLSICDASNSARGNSARLVVLSQLGSALSHRGQFVEAEPLLLQAYNQKKGPMKVSKAGDCGNSPMVAWSKCRALERIVRMYESWDAAEPGKGYAEKAAEWRAKLDELKTTP